MKCNDVLLFSLDGTTTTDTSNTHTQSHMYLCLYALRMTEQQHTVKMSLCRICSYNFFIFTLVPIASFYTASMQTNLRVRAGKKRWEINIKYIRSTKMKTKHSNDITHNELSIWLQIECNTLLWWPDPYIQWRLSHRSRGESVSKAWAGIWYASANVVVMLSLLLLSYEIVILQPNRRLMNG